MIANITIDYCDDCIKTNCEHRGNPTNLIKGEDIPIGAWKIHICKDKITMEDLKRATKA